MENLAERSTLPSGDRMASVSRVGVLVASRGRPASLAALLASLRSQHVRADQVVVVVTEPSDLPSNLDSSSTVAYSRPGSAIQRNVGLDILDNETDLVVILDDDVLLDPQYIAIMRDAFASNESLVGATGYVLRDGAAEKQEISVVDANAMLQSNAIRAGKTCLTNVGQLFGCNMVVRYRPGAATRFDESMPLYAWLEDVDFSVRLGRLGLLAHVWDAKCVHRGALSGGRVAHVRMGYTQVANPVYLRRKGTLPGGRAAYIEKLARTVPVNLTLALSPHQGRWRRLRLKGNLLAYGDWATGNLRPSGVLSVRDAR